MNNHVFIEKRTSRKILLMLFLFFFLQCPFTLSLSIYFDVLLLFCQFSCHVNQTIYPSSPTFSVSASMKNTIFFCHFIFPFTHIFLALTHNHLFQSFTPNPALPIVLPASYCSLISISHLLLPLLHTGSSVYWKK